MADITLTAAMRANLLQLQQTASLMDTTQTRISTGKKVNTALDDPNAFFTAKGLTDKASDFAVLKDGMGQSISAIQTADKAITAITELVQQAKALANSAKSAATTTEKASLASQYDALLAQIDKLAGDATYNGINLVAGRGVISGGDWTDTVTAADALAGIAATAISNVGSETQELSFDLEVQGQYGGAAVAVTDGAAEIWTQSAAETLVVNIGTDSVGGDGWTNSGANITFTVVDADTLTASDGAHTATVEVAALVAGGATASFTLGDLDVDLVSSAAVTFNVGQNSSVAKTDSNQRQITATALGATDTQAGNDGAVTFTNAAWNGDELSFTATEAQLVVGNTATVTRTNVGGAGENDMKVEFNQDGSAFINVQAVRVDSIGLGLDAASNNWATKADIDAAISDVTAALSSLRGNAQALSTNLSVIQTREDFTSQFINALQEGADKLTLADGNEEATNMLMLQTRQQLGIQALSMASQSAQSILSLFR